MAVVSQLKHQIAENLHAVRSQPMRVAALKFWETLGYQSTRTLDLETKDQFRQQFDPENRLDKKLACYADWQEVEFLFQLTDEDLQQGGDVSLFGSTKRVENQEIHSYVFFAIRLLAPNQRSGDRKGKSYTRTDLAGITRAVNRLLVMPALLLFVHGDSLTLAVTNRRLHKRDESRDVLEKVTVIKDIALQNPHRAHIEILHDLSLGALYARHRFTNFVGLHRAWASALDSSELNKRFYLDIANWFFWASRHAKFPRPAHLTNADAYQSLSLIRLITRLVFCWFLKEKGLIPSELFQENRLQEILADLDPKTSTFYRAVLQNLFFATLSVPMDERRFIAGDFQGKSHDYGKQYVYRFKDDLRPEKMREMFGGVPFLNGGLFECLDVVPNRDEPDIEEVRIDGFSTNPAKQAHVPNFLFFGQPHSEDLRKEYGDELRFSQVTVLPLIEIFECYKFTVAENTPVEEEVALDPELLGLVFENLLASFNEETKTTARKQTGAFYTPRVVVDYMVDAALIEHFKEALGEAPDVEDRLKKLFSYAEEKNPFDARETARLLDAIDSGEGTIKILDPACGSGAFPMGILHRLVFLLQRLDPGNVAWRERQLARVRLLDVGREAAEKAVKEAFARHEDDYARKVFLIENCIYGVDINPIAVQIAKLRFFISLLVDQETSDTRENRGVLPLPNLETKFVAANTLFALRRRGQTLLVSRDVREKTAELLRVRHDHFNARHWKEKRVLRRKDKKLREDIASLLRRDQIVPGDEADQLAGWNPYAPNEFANFFDPEWMFALDAARLSKPAAITLRDNFAFINEGGGQTELIPRGEPTESGFDIVIGNPPYVRMEEITELKPVLREQYYCFSPRADLYVYFYERSFDLLRVGGMLSFISSNKYLRSSYGERLRQFLATTGEVNDLIDFGDAPVFTAIAYPSIILVRKIRETRDKDKLVSPPKKITKAWLESVPDRHVNVMSWEPNSPITEFPRIFAETSFHVPQRKLEPTGWRLEKPALSMLIDKVRSGGVPLSQYVEGRIHYGIKTGFNDAFVLDRTTKDQLIAEDKKSEELIKPWLRGRDVKRWHTVWADLFVIAFPFGFHSQLNRYPAILRHLSQFEKQLRARGQCTSSRGGKSEGQHHWLELDNNPPESYLRKFDEPKIFYQEIATYQAFAWNDDGYYANNKTFFIPNGSRYLLAILNSKVAWWFLGHIAGRMVGGAYAMQTPAVGQISIPQAPASEEQNIVRRVQAILSVKSESANGFVGNLEAEIDGLVAHLYGLSESEFNTILEELELPDPARLAAIEAYRDASKGLLT